jgi:hypothetical protein
VAELFLRKLKWFAEYENFGSMLKFGIGVSLSITLRKCQFALGRTEVSLAQKILLYLVFLNETVKCFSLFSNTQIQFGSRYSHSIVTSGKYKVFLDILPVFKK